MAAARENMTALTGGLVSLSVHALILSVVLVLPSSPIIAVQPVSQGDGAVMLFDPAKLPPLDEPPPPPETAEKPAPPPPLAVEMPKPPPVEIEPPVKKEIPLGIENGKADSKAWIKSVAEGEHTPRESMVEQPALSQSGGTSGPAGVPTPPAPAQPNQPQQPASTPSTAQAQPTQEPSQAPMPAKPDGASDQPRPGTPIEREPTATEPKPPADRPVAEKEQEAPKPLELDPKRLLPSDMPDGPAREKVEGESGAAPSTLPTGPKQEGVTTASRDNAEKPQPAVTAGATPDPRDVTVQPEREPAQAQAPRPAQDASQPQPSAKPPEPAAPPARTADVTVPGAPKIIDAAAPTLTKPDTSAPRIPSPTPPTTAGQPGVGGQGDNRGDKSDRDSDAATLKRTGKFYKSGRVDAGEGLEIRTVRPNYTLYAQTFANPRSPVVEIHFARDGTVRNVRIMRSSGFPGEIDEPIIAACYNWQATGKALKALPDRPDAAVMLTIQFLLN